MEFTKMQGAGNDFIIIDNRQLCLTPDELSALARRVCRRRVSMGADGLMAVGNAKSGGDFAMLFFNADGSLGEMCGNGARCICRWGYEHGLSGQEQRIETTAGPVTGLRESAQRYRIRLNDPSRLEPYFNISLDGVRYDCGYAELGTPGLPHAVIRMDDFTRMDRGRLRSLGARLRSHPSFPKGANVTFWEPAERGAVTAETFERGVEDFTLACGTGAGSLVSVMTVRGLSSGQRVAVRMPGGELSIDLSAEGGWVHDIFLTGPAVIVATGTLISDGED